jgi:hypothetical protein
MWIPHHIAGLREHSVLIATGKSSGIKNLNMFEFLWPKLCNMIHQKRNKEKMKMK